METRTSEYISKFLLKLQEDPSLQICSISHVELEDEGCQRLFTWLRTGIDLKKERSGIGASETNISGSSKEKNSYPRRLSRLELNDVQMTDTGFQYLIEWLESLRPIEDATEQALTNVELRTVILRANLIEGTSKSAGAFVAALPKTVSTLILSNNYLSSPFRQALLGSLSTLPHLRRLLMPMTGMDFADSKILSSYIGGQSPRCTLAEINASGNFLNFKGIKIVIDAMSSCWSLQKVELFSNFIPGVDLLDLSAYEGDEITIKRVMTDLSISETEAYRLAQGNGSGISFADRKLMFLLARNIYLKKEVEKEALDLFKYSRLLLYKPINQLGSSSTPQEQCNDCECMPASVPPPPVAQNTQAQSPPNFSFIPIELQLDILSYTAPHLSFKQRIRIFDYAVDKKTLPRLQLCLPTFKNDPPDVKNCIVDPSSLVFASTKIPTGISQSGEKVGSPLPDHSFSSCVGGQCLGSNSVVCQRQIEKERWLELVGCESYDIGD